jgi:hypothetical protein
METAYSLTRLGEAADNASGDSCRFRLTLFSSLSCYGTGFFPFPAPCGKLIKI